MTNASGETCGRRARRTHDDEGKDEGPWRLRAKDDQVRAILSNRYSPLDNGTLMSALAPLLDSRHRVDWFGLSSEAFHLRIVDPVRTTEILPGDAVAVGIHIANSEVGFRSVTVDALVYRLVCSNGLIALEKGKSLMRQRHVHLEHDRFVSFLETAIAGAMVTADCLMEKLRQTSRVPVPDVEGTIEKYSSLWDLSETTTDLVKTMLVSETALLQETLYGVVNAFTAAAQRLPDEHRYDLEVRAGQLAELGVAAFAPRVLDTNGAEGTAPSGPNGAIELAKELFGAEVIGRQPHQMA